LDIVASILRPSFIDEPDFSNPFRPEFDLFNDQPPLVQSDVGSTRVITAANSAAFGNVVGLLTNGLPDVLTVGEGVGPTGGGYRSSYEAYALYGDLNDPRIDLHGFQIDSFNLTLNRLSFANDGHNTTFSYHYTVSIQGEPVPEPGTLAALFFSGFCVIRRRQRGS
jgi:hypothetical protein